MLAKRHDGVYSQIQLLPSGVVSRNYGWDNKDFAINDMRLIHCYNSIQYLKDDGWKLLPPDLGTLSVGDYVKDDGGNKRRVLTAQGVGEFRTYMLSIDNFCNVAGSYFTAEELKDNNYTPLPWEEQEPETEELTIKEVCKELGRTVKIKK